MKRQGGSDTDSIYSPERRRYVVAMTVYDIQIMMDRLEQQGVVNSGYMRDQRFELKRLHAQLGRIIRQLGPQDDVDVKNIGEGECRK